MHCIVGNETNGRIWKCSFGEQNDEGIAWLWALRPRLMSSQWVLGLLSYTHFKIHVAKHRRKKLGITILYGGTFQGKKKEEKQHESMSW